MASLRVLAFDHEGRPIQFDTWLHDIQLCLLSDSKDSVSLFDLVSGAATAPPTTADSATRSQWLTRDAAACLAIRNHLPLAECTHFRQHRTAQALYTAVVARYTSPATAALGRLLLPFLIPELSAFEKVEDLVSHLLATALPSLLRLSLDPTSLIVDLLEQHLLTAETSAVAVGAARGTPRQPFFEGCSPSPLAPSYAYATAAADVSVAEEVEAASASAKCRNSKGKGGRGGGGGSGGGGGGSGSGGGASLEVVEALEVVGAVGLVAGVGALVAAAEAALGVAVVEAVGLVAVGLDLGMEALVVATGSSSSVGARPSRPSSSTCGKLHTQHRCFSRLDNAWRAEFGDDVELPRWADLLSYMCVPPDPGIAAAALGASESGTLPDTAPAQALHTLTLDSGASRCFFRDSTTLTALPAPVLVRLADPSGSPVVARSSTVLPCPAVPSGSLSGLHLPSFSTNLVRHPPLARVTSCRTRLSCGTTASVTRPCHAFVACTLVFLTLVFPGPCLPSHPHLPRSAFLASRGGSAPLLTPRFPRRLLPCRLSTWTFYNYTRYTTVFPLHSKGLFVDVLIPWICTVRLHLRKRFGQDLPVLRLHSNRGGEFSSNLLMDFCHGEGILQLFTLPDSPQQNGIAERRIGLVMEVARTFIIHAAAPHFLWPFAVQYAALQLNLWPRVSFSETSPTLRLMGEVGDASVFWVWGSRAFVRDTSADKLSARAIPCVFLGFVPDAPGWQFYHPTSRRVLPPQDITFDESVPFYRAFGGAAFGGAEPGGAESEGAGSGGAELEGEEPGSAEPAGVEPEGVEPRDAESEGAESGGADLG
ncbi:unnamed protein product, partial [Closterium sp. NIES-53]